MSKRGIFRTSKKSTLVTAEVLLTLFGLILVVGTYLILAAQVNGIKNDTTFEQLYLSRDIALLIDALQASPGEISYRYSNSIISRFGYIFKGNKLDINFEGVVKSYPYLNDASSKLIEARILLPKTIIFEKSSQEFNIKKENENTK